MNMKMSEILRIEIEKIIPILTNLSNFSDIEIENEYQSRNLNGNDIGSFGNQVLMDEVNRRELNVNGLDEDILEFLSNEIIQDIDLGLYTKNRIFQLLNYIMTKKVV